MPSSLIVSLSAPGHGPAPYRHTAEIMAVISGLSGIGVRTQGLPIGFALAGAVGLEPTIMEPESIALPLGYAPKTLVATGL